VSDPDRWADWLLRGRVRGLDQRQVEALERGLHRLRDRVLAGARLRRGMTVVDVGAGTGLLALDAARRVGDSGRVIALDVSHAALVAGRRGQRSGDPLGAVVGDAVSLPLADHCADAVVIRSALIYVVDKARAAAELHRVLRPGGRVSVFEPINSGYRSFADVDLSDLDPARTRVMEQWVPGGGAGAAMRGFDERDLVGYFADAGFESVELTLEVTHRRAKVDRRQVAASLTMRPNPNMVSYEETARAVLGDAADDHLRALAIALTTRPSTSVSTNAFVRARRARRARAATDGSTPR
jgi:arsenite methyltransferase